MDKGERQRRHDELWQSSVLDALARMLDVLHDLSDGLRQVADAVTGVRPDEPSKRAEGRQQLLSVNDLAELFGVSPSAIRSLRASGQAPIATKVGGRVFFHQTDVEAWLRRQRQVPGDDTRPWRKAYLPGRVGSNVPRSSEPAVRAFCNGSHSEPMAASMYSGRAVCRICKDDVIVNRDGRLRKHYPRSW